METFLEVIITIFFIVGLIFGFLYILYLKYKSFYPDRRKPKLEVSYALSNNGQVLSVKVNSWPWNLSARDREVSEFEFGQYLDYCVYPVIDLFGNNDFEIIKDFESTDYGREQADKWVKEIKEKAILKANQWVDKYEKI